MSEGDRYTCQRCQGSWVSRIDAKPKRCPSCGSYAWDKPKVTVAS